ncbi:MAG: paraquat-inducible protein A [Pseudomonadota bacterium]
MNSARDLGYAVCRVCHTITADDGAACEMCGARVHARIPASLQRTWAFLIAGVAAYVPGNMLPIMITATPRGESPSTIVGGVVTLFHHGSYAIAAVILIASVAVPVSKFIVIAWVSASIRFDWKSDEHSRHRSHELVELLGAWSMVDVFVVAALAALIQLGGVMNVRPGPGAEYFALSVALTMLSARSLDTRLIWDAAKHG